MKRDLRNVDAVVRSIYSPERGEVESAPHPKEELFAGFSERPEKGDIIRKKPED